MGSKELTRLIIEILEDKKALNVESFYMEQKTILADYYIVCTGTSVTHIKALAGGIQEKLKEKGIELLHMEGYETARWILLDYGTVVVHIMHEVDRGYYDLETLFERGHEQKRRG